MKQTNIKMKMEERKKETNLEITNDKRKKQPSRRK
jgi:hypothetical protein